MSENRIILPGESTLEDYLDKMIQRRPRYGIKPIGRGKWKTMKKPLSDRPIRAHLDGEYNVSVLGTWYPEYAILDIDSRPRKEVDEIRARLELDESNSMLQKSESEDSYHIIFTPEYRGKPPTLNLLDTVLKPFCEDRRIEIYPQRRRTIRLPFGPHQPLLDYEYMGLDSWKQKLYWFEKLDGFDLSSVKYHQLLMDFEPGPGRLELPSNFFQEAQYLLDDGLQFPSTRHESQGRILFYLWRQNVPAENAVGIVWEWINEKHNGFSKDILRSPRHVKKDIESQAAHLWRKYHMGQIYPDSTHNLHHGYITKPDIPEIVEAVRGSLPRMKFLFNLVKYSYPRRHRKSISIHRDKLIGWASTETYLRYLGELGSKGIAERKSAYRPGLYSKDLKLNWKFRTSNEAVLFEGRSIETLDDAVKLNFKPDEFRQILASAGTPRKSRYTIIKSIWR